MFSKKEILKRSLAGLMTAAIVLTGVQTPVQADNLQDEVTLHAGATAVMNGAYGDAEQKTDNTDLQAGAALYLEKDGEELAAVTEVDAGAAIEEAVEEEESSDVVMANVNDAVNVRVEPNEEAEVAGKLYKNCGGTILEQADGWTKLTSGELTGWTKDEFLLFGDEAEAMQQEVGSLKATVKTDALRVRKEANEEAGIYTVLALGESVTAVEEADGWVTVQVDEDTQGYVSADYVDVAFTVETGKTNEQIEAEKKEEEKKKLSENRGAVSCETSDVTLLAALIQCEAGRESYEGKLAVGAVVMNRVRSGSYPGSVSGVVNAPSQFPPATNGKVAAVIANGPSASCVEAAQAAINGATNVGGATHFKAASSGQAGVVIGNHVFW
ncbi:cell wall hydrolase [Kineothrix sp. MSJ-39]|uniref:cell wall hydrolase n=1 Tax=Kineothrix sp. MSJ-39 TaxID=2841533 RepID=UPI001C10B87E|nr:cell wall hydrolase [Kineothrix sp. MSJ-39]MBU5430557.1 cell wall hydrolase [Kineothrix sp. MSJ-39]